MSSVGRMILVRHVGNHLGGGFVFGPVVGRYPPQRPPQPLARIPTTTTGTARTSAVRCLSAAKAKTKDKKQAQQQRSPSSKGKNIPSKNKDRSSSASSSGSSGGRSRELDLILASLDAPSKKEGPISEEEAARRHKIGRDYVIGRFRQNNEIDHDLSCKIKLKLHALDMLPKGSKIREAAFEIDEEQAPPMWRHVPVWTPPIPGFDPSQFIEEEEKK